MVVSLPLRLLIAAFVAGLVILGVWVTGGLITDDFKTSFLLTAAWFVVAAGGCLAVARSVPAFRVPILLGYFVTTAVVGGYLAWSTLHDEVVHERVVVGIPASHVLEPSRPTRPVTPVQVALGRFRSGEHSTAGSAAIVRLSNGRLVLTLTDFRTSPGPDLRVRLVPGHAVRGDVPGNRDLGALKGNIGNQQYDVPHYDVPQHDATVNTSVIIWCRAFSATFGAATLAPS